MHPIEQLRFVARAAGADARLLVEEAASALTVFRHDHRALVMACRRLVDRQPMVAPLWWLCSRIVTTGDVVAEARSVVKELREDPTSGSLADHLTSLTASMSSTDHAGPKPEPTIRVAVAGWPDVVVAGIVEASTRTRSAEIGALVVDVEGQGPALVRHLERVDIVADDVDPARMSGVARSADLVVVEAAVTNGRRLATDIGSVGLMAAARAADTPVCCVVPVGRALPDEYWDVVVAAGGSPLAPWLSPIETGSLALADTVIAGSVVVPRSDGADSWSDTVNLALAPAWRAAPELLP